MTGVYDELALDKMVWKETDLEFVADCPCGDVFKILVDDLFYGEDIAYCDSCSLVLRVNFTEVSSPPALPPVHGAALPAGVARRRSHDALFKVASHNSPRCVFSTMLIVLS